METTYLLPQDLSTRILQQEIQVDSTTLSQDLLATTVQLYVEAISYFTSLSTQTKQNKTVRPLECVKRSTVYQQKIKRLLVRKDVHNCLTNRESNPNGASLQKRLELVSLHAPEQARALSVHYKRHIFQQERALQESLKKQKTDLSYRLERRSKSRNRKQTMPCPVDLPILASSKRFIAF